MPTSARAPIPPTTPPTIAPIGGEESVLEGAGAAVEDGEDVLSDAAAAATVSDEADAEATEVEALVEVSDDEVLVVDSEDVVLSDDELDVVESGWSGSMMGIGSGVTEGLSLEALRENVLPVVEPRMTAKSGLVITQ